MEFTGERFVPSDSLMNDDIAFEHLHRYNTVEEIVKKRIVLDIASGEGYGTAILAKHADKVFGVDIDPKAIEHAKKEYSGIKNIEFLIGNANNIPLPDDSIDIVVSYETIEHIDELTQKKFLSEIKRVLKKEGQLIVSTPDKTNYSDRYDHKNEFHLKEFTSDEFFKFLKNYFKYVTPYLQGYEIVSAITENEPEKINNLHITNWQRLTKPFSRKYLIGICSDRSLPKNITLSSVVFQVNKDFMQMTDRIVQMEAHILELGAWGRRLDKQIEEKNVLFNQKARELEKTASEKEKQSMLLQKVSSELENKKKLIESFAISFQETTVKLFQMQKQLVEESELKQKFKNEILEKESLTAELQNTIIAIEEKIEQQKNAINTLTSENNDKNKIIEEQNRNVHSLQAQLNSLSERLTEIYRSEGWKILKRYYNLKGKLLPETSKRYRILKKVVNRLRGKKEDNLGPFDAKQSQVITASLSTNNSHSEKSYEPIEFVLFESSAVSIVMPAYNGWDLTYKCLASIKKNTHGISYEIIIGDDASTDETKNIKNYIKNITVIRNEKNLEFLHNCNHAATYVKGKYILFLNNDTEVRSGWLSSMVDLMEKDETIGMVGSKLIYPNGLLQEAGAIIWNDASGWNFGHKKNPESPEFNYVKEVDYISGASIIIRTDLWKEIGGFDERYTPAYCEDSDLAFEVRKHGYKVVYQPLSEVIHFEGYTHGTDQEEGIKGNEIKAYQKLNNEKFKEKWKNVLQKEHFPNGENVFWARDKSQNRKTILVIDHYVPQFDKDAGSKTVFQYLKLFVSLNMNVKFIGDNYCRHEPYTTALQQMGIEVLYGPYYANNWRQWIKDNHDKFDFILLNRPHISIKYIDFIRKNTNAKILYYGHDLHFIREQKQYTIERNSSLLESSKKWKATEMHLFDNSDIVLTPSEDEKSIIDNLVQCDKTRTVLPYYYEKANDPISDFTQRESIMFVGGFAHKPNVDAVLWFCNEIWPTVKKELPQAKFIVVGSNTPDQIFHLASEDVIIKGYLNDIKLDQIYSSVKIVAVPLRYGAGVKGKTVEALHRGIPIVTTSFGVEGLPGDYSFLQVTDNEEEFSERICSMYKNEKILTEQSKKSINYIIDNFSEKKARMILKTILETL
jgi:GT2 family glycosyltransferase/ubiquinone/menaquinone biosynthesis C-methylase UbiE